ncbi:MAG TPA: NADH-quinone oxidoreductase subunit N [Actinobacteria bacterium]|jgi:NADH-quinone oxidoreductase subunit N|nr:NADH-quinone oxidoreductase subunit N [Actinomycetota bacterium]HCP61086.1 NADH-quinone oxidoreductase subunit N [Actinomycetota bacterium]
MTNISAHSFGSVAAAVPFLHNPAIDWHAISPELVLAGTIFLVLIVDLFLKPGRKHLAMPVAFVGVAGSLAATLTLAGSHHSTFGGSYVVDNYAVLFKVFFMTVALVVLLLSYRYFRDGRYYQGEYYFLLLCSFLGAMTMPSSRDLLMLFISLELVSAPAFLLAGFRKKDPRSNEAALKFFLIGVLSTAVMLYGMSLIYGITGTTRLAGIAAKLSQPSGSSNLALAAILFVVAGFAFKVSAFPFQFWAPDTYEGSPVPVAAFLSVASKAAGFAGLLQLMYVAFLPQAHFWAPIFLVFSLFTMTLGNLVAMQQKQVVRLFAYSSIAQAGYILLPFALAGHSASVDREAFAAAVLYILIYGLMNLGAFAVLIGMSREAPGMLVSDFDGLGQRAPALAISMAMFLVSLAGIPPLAGFWAKFFIFRAAIDRGGVGVYLAVMMIINSVVSLVYYFSIIKAMFFQPVAEPVRPVRPPILVMAVVVVAAATVLAVGVYPPLFAHFPHLSTLIGR